MARTNLRLAAIAIVALIFCLALPGVVAVTGTLGTSTAVTANAATTVSFVTGEELVITSDSTGTVTVSANAVAAVTLPSGYVQLGAGIGYTIVVVPSTAVFTATFTTSPASVSTSVLAAASASVPGVLYYQSTSQAYADIGVPATVTNGQVSFTMPFQGQYLVLGIQTSAARPAIYGVKVVCQNDDTARTYKYGTDFRLNLQPAGGSTSSLTVTQYTSSSATYPTGYIPLNKFYNVTFTGASSFAATLTQEYTAAEVQARNINPATLRFAVLASGQWNLRSSGNSVDTSAKSFSQSTTSFSEWGTFGQANGASTAAALSIKLAVVMSAVVAVVAYVL